MQDLNYNTGMMELAIQGDQSRILRFNPSDGNIANGFLQLITNASEKLKEFSNKEFKSDNELENIKQKNKIDLELDQHFRSELDLIFGAGTSDMVFGNLCTTAITENGECIFINFLMALMPFISKEMQERNAKIEEVINKYKPKG
ncbi:hypothetical protein [Anaerovorax odorimutans]|uniref:hypothetical protein n=1 Tax=Anaerovorax odorimutans TaxID=109327 RepID=UPI0004070ADD|nr:hypothetical protein [Anaerovorax odorimutans]